VASQEAVQLRVGRETVLIHSKTNFVFTIGIRLQKHSRVVRSRMSYH